MVNIVIVGAGLSGLICAKRLLQLSNSSHHIYVLEGRERFGGRIYQEGSVDMGATWSWPSHDTALMKEASALGVQLEPQNSDGMAIVHNTGVPAGSRNSIEKLGSGISPSGEGSTRFVDGAASIIERLVAELKTSDRITLELNQEVRGVTRTSQSPLSYEVTSTSSASSSSSNLTEDAPSQCKFLTAAVVIFALPPQLVANVAFSPPLPAKKHSAMQRTPTWMADTGKVAFVYERPFWREQGLSGTAFSQGGPLAQIWDASSQEGGSAGPARYALSAFVFDESLQYLTDELAIRSSPIMSELVDIFGEEAARPVRIVYKSWQDDPFTSSRLRAADLSNTPQVPLGHSLVSSALEGIIFSGTETYPGESGHMNGAVLAGERAAAEAVELLTP